MKIVQYFVFDKTGNEVLEADCFACETEQEVNELVEEMKYNYHNEPDFQDTQLTISCGSQVLFNSSKEN